MFNFALSEVIFKATLKGTNCHDPISTMTAKTNFFLDSKFWMSSRGRDVFDFDTTFVLDSKFLIQSQNRVDFDIRTLLDKFLITSWSQCDVDKKIFLIAFIQNITSSYNSNSLDKRQSLFESKSNKFQICCCFQCKNFLFRYFDSNQSYRLPSALGDIVLK